jgi:aspartate-semialdehyde dehydrogenase
MDVASGYNEEELKMVKETRKIWENKDVSLARLPASTHACATHLHRHMHALTTHTHTRTLTSLC